MKHEAVFNQKKPSPGPIKLVRSNLDAELDDMILDIEYESFFLESASAFELVSSHAHDSLSKALACVRYDARIISVSLLYLCRMV